MRKASLSIEGHQESEEFDETGKYDKMPDLTKVPQRTRLTLFSLNFASTNFRKFRDFQKIAKVNTV